MENGALVDNPPNSWPLSAESGWQEYRDKVDENFEELAGTVFNRTVFEGSAEAQASL